VTYGARLLGSGSAVLWALRSGKPHAHLRIASCARSTPRDFRTWRFCYRLTPSLCKENCLICRACLLCLTANCYADRSMGMSSNLPLRAVEAYSQALVLDCNWRSQAFFCGCCRAMIGGIGATKIFPANPNRALKSIADPWRGQRIQQPVEGGRRNFDASIFCGTNPKSAS